jgi:hypothetical protein
MPSEPIEAEFTSPPALSKGQEDEFRQLEMEGPLSSTDGKEHDLADLERALSKEGNHIVTFESGNGEDPREWGKGKKWYVLFRTCGSLKARI